MAQNLRDRTDLFPESPDPHTDPLSAVELPTVDDRVPVDDTDENLESNTDEYTELLVESLLEEYARLRCPSLPTWEELRESVA